MAIIGANGRWGAASAAAKAGKCMPKSTPAKVNAKVGSGNIPVAGVCEG
jgi:hypothetical protein